MQFQDTPAIDAFGRMRVSEPSTIFDSKLLHGKNDLVWDEVINDSSGSADATFDTDRVKLTVGADADDYVIRQTKMRFNYLPGKSHLIFMTFVFADCPCTQRVGYFNTSTVAPYTASADGVWLEMDGGKLYWCLSRGGSLRKIEQSGWNVSTCLPGTASRSGTPVVIDKSAPLIVFVDLEWLGVGRVRCGFVVGGLYVVCHQFRNANDQDGTGISEPYIESPNHSLRYEIRGNAAGGGTLTEICGSVQSEGGYDLVGNLFSANRGVTQFTTANNTSVYPVLSLRLRSDRPDGTVIAFAGSILCTTTAAFVWTLRMNPTVSGTDAASWTQVGGNSSAEYDISRDNTNTITGGTIVASGYIAATNQTAGNLNIELNSAVRPGIAIDGTQCEMVLCVQNTSAGIEDYYAALNWREPL